MAKTMATAAIFSLSSSYAVGAEVAPPPSFCTIPGMATAPLPNEPKIKIDADETELAVDGVSRFTGNVKLRFEQRLLNAESLQYDRQQQVLTSSGGIRYQDPFVIVRGQGLEINAEQRSAEFDAADFVLSESGARGLAGRMKVSAAGQAEFNNVSYTTCAAEQEDWRLTASSIDIDNETGVGTARNARLYFKGVPFFYMPYMSFPISGERKTGWLIPRIGSSDESGLDVSVPFYWNAAPNADVTLTPHVLSNRGLFLETEARVLTARHEAQLNFNWLPRDERFGGSRQLIRYQQETKISKNWDANIDFSRASDRDYFADFGNSLSLASTSFLEQKMSTEYFGSWYTLSAALEDYQVLDRSVASGNQPYRLLPRINFSGIKSLGGYWQFDLKSDLSHFRDSDRVSGTRFDVYPSVSWSYFKPGFWFEPSVGFRSTHYALNDNGDDQPNNASRNLPIFKVESGLIFERPFNLGSLNRTQTLEPRIQYLHIPFEDQDDIPLFDTAEPDFNISRVFAENRFIGADRLNDARRFAFGLTSRFLRNDNGRETLRLQAAQAIDTVSPRVEIDNDTSRQRRSEIILTSLYRPTLQWRANAEFHWDSAENSIVRSAMQLGYTTDSGLILNLGYRRRITPEKLEQGDFSFVFPISQQWRAVGRWNYSLREKATLESIAGLEFENCCYSTRFVVRRFREPGSGELENRLFFELELRGLTAIGNRIENILERGILGYQR